MRSRYAPSNLHCNGFQEIIFVPLIRPDLELNTSSNSDSLANCVNERTTPLVHGESGSPFSKTTPAFRDESEGPLIEFMKWTAFT